MRGNLILAVCGLTLLGVLECPVLLAQTEDAKPISTAAEVDIHTCDSLKNPVPGESLGDASRRMLVWRGQMTEQHKTKWEYRFEILDFGAQTDERPFGSSVDELNLNPA
jgi:hypothetical protein